MREIVTSKSLPHPDHVQADDGGHREVRKVGLRLAIEVTLLVQRQDLEDADQVHKARVELKVDGARADVVTGLEHACVPGGQGG